jgi:hypothetical protein
MGKVEELSLVERFDALQPRYICTHTHTYIYIYIYIYRFNIY